MSTTERRKRGEHGPRRERMTDLIKLARKMEIIPERYWEEEWARPWIQAWEEVLRQESPNLETERRTRSKLQRGYWDLHAYMYYRRLLAKCPAEAADEGITLFRLKDRTYRSLEAIPPARRRNLTASRVAWWAFLRRQKHRTWPEIEEDERSHLEHVRQEQERAGQPKEDIRDPTADAIRKAVSRSEAIWKLAESRAADDVDR